MSFFLDQFQFHISSYHANKVWCLLNITSRLPLREEEKHIHANCIMIWCSFDSFEQGKPTCFWFRSSHAGQSCLVLLEIFVPTLPAQPSLTSDRSHGTHVHSESATQWTWTLFAKMTPVKLFNSLGNVCVDLLFSHSWVHRRGRWCCLITELCRPIGLWLRTRGVAVEPHASLTVCVHTCKQV